MKLEEMLTLVDRLDDQELDQLARAADWELQDRAYRKPEAIESLGLTPVYRCPDHEHQCYGLHAEDPDHPGFLVCGCLVSHAEFVSYE